MITNRQNHLVHHLIGTKLHCALSTCTSVQNYIVNLDLHICCQPQNTIDLYRLYTPIVCSCVPANTDKKCLFSHVPCDPSKNEKCRGQPPLLTDIGPPCAQWCTTQPVVHNTAWWCTTYSCTHEVVHNVTVTDPYANRHMFMILYLVQTNLTVQVILYTLFQKKCNIFEVVV